MADTAAILTGGVNSFQTTAEHLNKMATNFYSDGVVGAITNTAGVAPMTGALAVNAQGTPNMTVAVTAGDCLVTATPTSQASQRITATIAAQNVTIASNATGSTRYDWIYVQISGSGAAAPAANGTGVATIVQSRSTSNSVDNGTPPTYGFHLATVTVANGAVSIANGSIADTRTQTGPKAIDTSTASNGIITAPMLATSAITLGYAQITSNFATSSTTAVQVTGLTTTVTIPAGGRRVKITAYCAVTVQTVADGELFMTIWDGTVGSGTTLNYGYAVKRTAGSQGMNSILAQAIHTPSAGTRTYNISLNVGGVGGTGTLQAQSTAPVFILVEAI